MALVALPMSPCALAPESCDVAERVAGGPDAPAEHSCCADRAGADGKDSHNKPAAPCTRGCCRLNATAPTVEKVVAEQPSWATTTFLPPSATAFGVDASLGQRLLLPAQTLHSLSCLWRC